jgi:UPF0716 family protein affecting phage T7 exclusion
MRSGVTTLATGIAVPGMALSLRSLVNQSKNCATATQVFVCSVIGVIARILLFIPGHLLATSNTFVCVSLGVFALGAGITAERMFLGFPHFVNRTNNLTTTADVFVCSDFGVIGAILLLVPGYLLAAHNALMSVCCHNRGNAEVTENRNQHCEDDESLENLFHFSHLMPFITF